MMGRNDKRQKPLFYAFSIDDPAPVTPAKRVSPTDPQARWTAAPGGPAFYAYSTNYLVDTEAGIIVDVEATPAHRTLEVQSTKTMIEWVEERLALKIKKLIGDTAYGTAEFLAWMVEDKGIEPHMPVWEKAERRDGTLGRSDFSYDAVEEGAEDGPLTAARDQGCSGRAPADGDGAEPQTHGQVPGDWSA